MSAWLGARGLRVDQGGGPLFEGLSFEVEEDRVGLWGAWDGLFLAVAGQADVVSGTLELAGAPPREALARGISGLALETLDVPTSWTAQRVLEVSGRLRGLRAREARARGAQHLRRLALERLLQRPLGAMPLPERRALAIANATLTQPRALLVQSPVRGLDRHGAEFVRGVLARIGPDTRLAFSCDAADDHALWLLGDCRRVLVLQHGALVAEGPPQTLFQQSSYLIRTLSGAQRLAGALEAAGISVRSEELDDEQPATLWVELGSPERTRELLSQALATRAEVIEMVPMPPLGEGPNEERAMARS